AAQQPWCNRRSSSSRHSSRVRASSAFSSSSHTTPSLRHIAAPSPFRPLYPTAAAKSRNRAPRLGGLPRQGPLQYLPAPCPWRSAVRSFSPLLLLALLPSLAHAQESVAPSDKYADALKPLDAFIERQVEQHRLPALSIALVDGDRVVWAK